VAFFTLPLSLQAVNTYWS